MQNSIHDIALVFHFAYNRSSTVYRNMHLSAFSLYITWLFIQYMRIFRNSRNSKRIWKAFSKIKILIFACKNAKKKKTYWMWFRTSAPIRINLKKIAWVQVVKFCSCRCKSFVYISLHSYLTFRVRSSLCVSARASTSSNLPRIATLVSTR